MADSSDGRDPLKTQIAAPSAPEGTDCQVPILSVITGPRIGSIHKFPPLEESSLTVGRTVESQFVINHPTLSRVHARFTWMRAGGGYHLLIEDLHSTNGTYVNGNKTDTTFLNDGDRVSLGEIALKFELLAQAEVRERERLVAKAAAAETDALTGLANRHYLVEAIPKILSESEGRDIPLSVLLLDLDKFKSVNDTLGHGVGDKVLTAAGALISKHIRSSDVGARFGGEEFVVVLPGSTIAGARLVAERIRCAFAAFDTSTIAQGLKMTVSIGVAQRQPAEPFEAVLKRADEALYRAKNAGRNRVEVDVPEAVPRGPATSTPQPAGL